MGPICYPEISVRNYHHTLHNIPEERGSRLVGGGNLQSCLVNARPSASVSVVIEQLGPPLTGFPWYIWWFIENLLNKFKFDYNLTRITGSLHVELLCLAYNTCRILLNMRNDLDKSCRENHIHTLCSITFSENPCRLWDTKGKHGAVGQAIDDIMFSRKDAICMLDN